MTQFSQRIGADYHLDPLDEEEVGEYIAHRLRTAGGDPQLFLPETYPVIWRASRGVPRLINMLSDMALVYGYAEQKERIDAALMEEVIKDKRGGLSPIWTQTNEANVAGDGSIRLRQ